MRYGESGLTTTLPSSGAEDAKVWNALVNTRSNYQDFGPTLHLNDSERAGIAAPPDQRGSVIEHGLVNAVTHYSQEVKTTIARRSLRHWAAD